MFRFTDPCSNLTCEHMCVNTQSGPKCLCSEEYTLAADARSCTGCFSLHSGEMFMCSLCFFE